MSAAARGTPFVVAAPSGTGKTTVCLALRERDPRLRALRLAHDARAARRRARWRRLPLRERGGVPASDRAGRVPRVGRSTTGTTTEPAGRRSRGRSRRASTCCSRSRCRARARCASGCADARLIFLLPPSMQALEARLAGRATDTAEQVAARLRTARSELAAVEEFDYAVVNDDLERCVRERAGDRRGRARRRDGRAAAPLHAGRGRGGAAQRADLSALDAARARSGIVVANARPT